MNGPAAPADRLLGIGEFARRSRLSLKALRLYDRLGLLTPAEIDPSSGYRRYRESQLFPARLVMLLRQLDMPLSTVREVLAAPGETGAEVLTAYWEAIERRVAGQRELATLLRGSLLGGAARFHGHEVHERDQPEQRVISEARRLRLDQLEAWLTGTKDRLSAIAHDHAGPAGPLFVVFHSAVNDDSDGPVEVCVPVRSDVDGLPAGVSMRVEAGHREAYVRVTKAQFDMPQVLSAYDAVERWMADRGVWGSASPREVYLPGVDIAAAGPTDPICDVAFPIQTGPA